MMDFLMQLSIWHWLILGVGLLILEVLTGSSGFLLWMAIAAGLVGLSLWILPNMSWITQLLSFSLLSILAVFSWWLYLNKYPLKTDQPTLNRRSEQYIGRIFTVDEPIVNGMGKIKVDDTTWRIRCNHVSTSNQVKIIGVDGTILIAEQIDQTDNN
jgi:membrane protein implicated in regulation of membrane protease activity